MPSAASALPSAEDIAHRLAQAEGADRISGLHALLVSQGDRLLFEHNDDGPVVLLGIHLCGSLSVQAVELFNRQPRALAMRIPRPE